MNIAEILTEQAAIRPTSTAIIEVRRGRTRTLSFSEIASTSGRVASMLSKAGLKAHDTALVLQPMSADLYIALVALFRLGMKAMFLDPSAGREHIEACCKLVPPRAFIGGSKAHLLRLLVPALRQVPHHFAIGVPVPGAVSWTVADRLPAYEDFADCKEETGALVTFTSGSTGQPKAALRSHQFLKDQLHAIEQSIGLPAGVVEMPTLPVFALANLAKGLTSVIPDADLRSPGKVNAMPILAQIDEFRVTRITASPAFLERIILACASTGRQLLGLKQIFTGGAPVFPGLLDKLSAIAPHAEIVAVYGSTEAEPIAEIAVRHIGRRDREAMHAGRGLLAGPPVNIISMKIMRGRWGDPVGPFTASEFADACVSQGEVGEIVVSGAHVLKRYLNGARDSETKFTVGDEVWHRTGDAGCLDEQERLWLLGRCSAIVRDDRGVLYPFAVECAAMECAGVRRSALLSRAGKRILAVEAITGVTVHLEELKESLSWAYLDRVMLVKAVPMDTRHNAKVDYTRLERVIDAADNGS